MPTWDEILEKLPPKTPPPHIQLLDEFLESLARFKGVTCTCYISCFNLDEFVSVAIFCAWSGE